MKIMKLTCVCCALVLVGAMEGTYFEASAAEEVSLSDTSVNLKEMPLLNGETWQAMTSGEKVAFVWGIGHVVTMEREVEEKRPELKKAGLASKMAEGLAGMPMKEVVAMVDKYYTDNSGSLSDPVMKVIWDRIVKPRIKAGFYEETKE